MKMATILNMVWKRPREDGDVGLEKHLAANAGGKFTPIKSDSLQRLKVDQTRQTEKQEKSPFLTFPSPVAWP